MIIVDTELKNRIDAFLIEFINYRNRTGYHTNESSVKYIESETFYMEFIKYLVSRGLQLK